jgi:hypothetical protein
VGAAGGSTDGSRLGARWRSSTSPRSSCADPGPPGARQGVEARVPAIRQRMEARVPAVAAQAHHSRLDRSVHGQGRLLDKLCVRQRLSVTGRGAARACSALGFRSSAPSTTEV